MCFSCKATDFVESSQPPEAAHAIMAMLFKLQPSRVREYIDAAEHAPAHGPQHPDQRDEDEERSRAFVVGLLRSMCDQRLKLLALAHDHGFPCPPDEPPSLSTGAAPSADTLAEMFGLKKRNHR